MISYTTYSSVVINLVKVRYVKVRYVQRVIDAFTKWVETLNIIYSSILFKTYYSNKSTPHLMELDN